MRVGSREVRVEPDGLAAEVDRLAHRVRLSKYELRAGQPLSELESLQREMDKAIAAEAYERAAELRDAIRAHQRKG